MTFRPLAPASGLFRTWRGRPATDLAHPVEPMIEHIDVAPTEDQIRAREERARAEGRAEVTAALSLERLGVEDLARTVGAAIDEVSRLRRQTLLGAAEDVAEIVRLFASRVVGETLALHPEALPGLVREAIEQLPQREEVVIAVAPHAAEQLSRMLGADLADRVVSDPAIEGGAIVRTRNATLDATLEAATVALDQAISQWLATQWWAGDSG